MSKNTASIFLSYLLRHNPHKIGLTLDSEGWADVNDLIQKSKNQKETFTLESLKQIVENDEKGRYSFDETGTKIRANQGHSIKVDLKLKRLQPPSVLYHGTSDDVVDQIISRGIKKMSRMYVHLSEDESTAKKVGERHGQPVVFTIAAAMMSFEGYLFYKSENGVWLTDYVPKKYVMSYQYV